MATESWVLDGIALTSGNFNTLELAADPPKARADWLTSADSENGVLMRDPLHENRTITMKLRVASQASMDAALDQVASIRDKFRNASRTPDGIALVWTPANSTRARTFDVLNGEITEMPIAASGQGVSWLLAQRPVFTVEMTCKPYWRGSEVTTSTASSSTPVVTMEIANVPGDIPALGRLIVTDTATQNRRHVEWGVENQYYTSGSPSTLLLDSDSLVTSGFAGTGTTRTGAYDPNATGNNIVRTTLFASPVACCGLGDLPHIGSFRVKARVWASTPDVRTRLRWQAGDGPLMANPWAEAPVTGAGAPTTTAGWAEIDLGVITVPPVATGTQRWTGRIEAYSVTVGDTLDVDYVLLIPAAEGYGEARSASASGPAAINGYDTFAGLGVGANLNTRTATAGGAWATSGAAGDFLGFQNASGEPMVTRGIASDASRRFAVLGATNYTDNQVEVFANFTKWSGAQVTPGVIARWTDSSNYLYAVMTDDRTYKSFSVLQRVAGVEVFLAYGRFVPTPNVWYGIRLTVYSSGVVVGEIRYGGTLATALRVKGYSAALATGGTLATGKPGFFDQNSSALSVSRYYDHFSSATPVAEPIVVYSGRSAQMRYDDAIRQDSTGSFYGKVPAYRGSRFLLQPGTNRVLAKVRRNDLRAASDDPVTDAVQIQVAYQPRGLVVPR